jgi:CheY-like chemotaxis protein
MNENCSNLGHRHVILVEDDQLLNEVLSMQLESAGINFCAASAGRQALALIQSHRPKALILDVAIGDFSAFDVIDAIKKDPDLATLNRMHVLVHTVHELSQEERTRLSFGKTRFFTKNVGTEDISQLVSQICKVD